MSSRSLYALLSYVLVTSVPASADILFTDGTFDPNNYNNFSATPNLDSGVTATYGQCLSCGNSGYGLQVLVTTPGNGGGGSYVGFLNDTFVYYPQTDGAIVSLSASVDKDVTLNRSTTDFTSYFYPFIEQGGNFYIAKIIGGTINSGTTTGYETIGQGLKATDFYEWTFGPPNLADSGSNPDFSDAGTPITFGLAPIVGANDAFTITVDYDNLKFDIVPSVAESPVPESSSLSLLSIFVLGLVLRGLGPAVRWKLKSH